MEKGEKMNPEKKANLAVIDVEAMSIGLEAIADDVKTLGRLEILEFKTGDFRADGTGQKGNISYHIAGKAKDSYVLGANGVTIVSMKTGFKPVIADNRLVEFTTSEHYSKLRQAKAHQVALAAKRKKK